MWTWVKGTGWHILLARPSDVEVRGLGSPVTRAASKIVILCFDIKCESASVNPCSGWTCYLLKNGAIYYETSFIIMSYYWAEIKLKQYLNFKTRGFMSQVWWWCRLKGELKSREKVLRMSFLNINLLKKEQMILLKIWQFILKFFLIFFTV
jgi:hypothetical protein